MGDWIDTYLTYTEQTESPKEFHRWVAISILAVTTNRNIFLDRDFYKLYPNLFILLIANSALCRKSTSINIGLSLLNCLNDPITYFADSCTTPSLLTTMAKENGKCFVCASEMSTFITDIYKTNLSPVITRLYDCPTSYKTATVKRGVETLYNVFLNLLGGTTPSDLNDLCAYDKAGAGLPSRFIFIHKEDQEKIIPHLKKTEELLRLEKSLINYLNALRKIEGEMTLSLNAYNYFSEWYASHCKQCIGKNEAFKAVQGYYGRKHDTLLKIGMILSLASSLDLVIHKRHLEKAHNLLASIENEQIEILRILSSTNMGLAVKEVEEFIKKRGLIGQEEIMKAFYHKWNAHGIATILDSLLQAETIELKVFQNGKKKFYQWRSKKNESNTRNKRINDASL